MVTSTLSKSLPATPKPAVRTIPAGEFKAKCLGLLDEVDNGELEILITKRGKPVARLVPAQEKEDDFVPLWGRTPGIAVPDDIRSLREDWPDPSIKWEKINRRKKTK